MPIYGRESKIFFQELRWYTSVWPSCKEERSYLKEMDFKVVHSWWSFFTLLDLNDLYLHEGIISLSHPNMCLIIDTLSLLCLCESMVYARLSSRRACERCISCSFLDWFLASASYNHRLCGYFLWKQCISLAFGVFVSTFKWSCVFFLWAWRSCSLKLNSLHAYLMVASVWICLQSLRD